MLRFTGAAQPDKCLAEASFEFILIKSVAVEQLCIDYKNFIETLHKYQPRLPNKFEMTAENVSLNFNLA